MYGETLTKNNDGQFLEGNPHKRNFDLQLTLNYQIEITDTVKSTTKR